MSIFSRLLKSQPAAPAVVAAASGQKGTNMSTTNPAPAPAPSASTSVSIFGKLWNWIKGEAKHVETGIADLFGSDAAAKIEAAGKALIESNFGPLVTAAVAEATDVATGQMSIGKAISTLIAMFEAEGKSLSQAAALQIIGLAQNALPANPSTVTPVA